MDFTAFANALQTALGAEIPRVLGSVSILVLGWLLAVLCRAAVRKALALLGVNKRIEESTGATMDAESPVSGAVFWLVLRGLVSSLLMAAGADKLNERIGLEQSVRLSALVGNVVFISVFVSMAIAALDTLGIEAISKPASAMLQQVFLAVPHILAAVVILLLTWYLSRFVSSLVSNLLESSGVDSFPHKIGLFPESTQSRPSAMVAWLIVFFAMMFAVTEAADQLGFAQVRQFTAGFVVFASDILLGSAILVVGYWLSNLAYSAIAKSDASNGKTLAGFARIAILGLVLGMGLRAMGIANDIVQMAFGLTLGAVAVAVAIAFGLGGRDTAAKLTEQWMSKSRED